MPPPAIQKANFNPVGRYVIDTAARKNARATGEDTIFHDSQNYEEQCGLDGGNTANFARFDNMTWAVQHGYKKCPLCFPKVGRS